MRRSQESREHYTFSDKTEDEALRAIAVMEQAKVVDLDRATALEAARLAIQHGIATADSVMLATAERHSATLWTQDADFNGLPGIKYFARQHRE